MSTSLFTKTKKPLRSDAMSGKIFVVGDANGDDARLEKMLDKIESFPLAANDKIVVLGNFISLDERVRDMLTLVGLYKQERPNNFHLIRGQREHTFIKFRKSLLTSPVGKDIIKTYSQKRMGFNTEYRIDTDLMISDRNWLKDNTKFFFETKHFFIVSSGVQPTVSLERQTQQSFMYIKQADMGSVAAEKKIVHGNAPLPLVDVKTNCITVSTKNGLSCVVLDDTKGVVEEVLVV